jgi:hypothetical protein
VTQSASGIVDEFGTMMGLLAVFALIVPLVE